MSVPVVLPNSSNFLGVAMVIRSRDGPRWVFHYPPHIHDHQARQAPHANEDEWDEEDFGTVDQLPRETTLDAARGNLPRAAELLAWNHDDHFVTESGVHLVPWEHVAGFPTKDLESILTPSRAYAKKLFQISLDPLHFVSHPIYVPETGNWKKVRKPPKVRRGTSTGGRDSDHVDPRDTGLGQGPSERILQGSDMERKDSARPAVSPAAEEAPDKVANMNMFNLVFILKPKRQDAKELVNIMYTHIIREVNKAYKYAQQRSEFVWKESKKIMLIKDKAREERKKMTVLWKEILAQSSLAASMRDVYQAVSQNKIAVLQLTTAEGTVAHSVQIPIPFFVEDLPTEGDDTSRGLWLTTANAMDEEDEPPDDSTLMDKNFALLLLDSEKKIISELEADPDETSQAMIEFVRTSRPTMSIYQVSENSSLSLHQVRRYAQHFIFWRRAIAIPPLHARDVYIVSPNCDLSQLPRASLEWQRNFPYAPPLADFLGELSAAPRPYKTFCPSKAFRPFYLHMLAYLMRNGWVTQLCTFAYVIVWPEIVYEVDYAEEGEAIRAAQEAAAARAAAAQAQAQAQAQVQQQQHHRRQQSHRSSYDSYDESDASEGGVVSDSDSAALLSSSGSSDATRRPSNPTVLAISPTALGFPSLHSSGPASPSSSTHGTTTNTGAVPVTPAVAAAERARLTRIAERSRAELAERVAAHARRPKPTPTDRPSTNPAPHLRRVPPHIIKDAGRASGREARYLEVIGARLAAAAERAREKEEREKAAALAEQERVRERAARERERERNQLSGRPPPPPPPSQTRTRGGNIGKEKGEEKGKESAAADGKGASSGLGQNQQQPPITADDRARAAQLWPSFWRYFNGRTALERVALQEDMKRKEAWQVLSAMSEYLLCVRHW